MPSSDELKKRAEVNKLEVVNSAIINDGTIKSILGKVDELQNQMSTDRKEALQEFLKVHLDLETCETLYEETVGTNSGFKMDVVLQAICKMDFVILKRRQADYETAGEYLKNMLQLGLSEQFKTAKDEFSWTDFRKVLLDIITEKKTAGQQRRGWFR